MQIRTIGAFYGNSGRIDGAEVGAAYLKRLADKRPGVSGGADISVDITDGRDKIAHVEDICRSLKAEMKQTLDRGEFALVLGGDHSIATGSVAGVLAHNSRNAAVVYIDAHADMNTFETSATQNIHGMPMAVCFGLGTPRLTEIVFPKLGTDKIILMGARSIDPGEARLIDEREIAWLSSDVLRKGNITDVQAVLKDFVVRGNIGQLHISFDIDVIDPQYAPGTGVPEPDGLTPEKALQLVDTVFDTGLVRSMDIVEYNPKLDVDNRTRSVCHELLERVFSRISIC